MKKISNFQEKNTTRVLHYFLLKFTIIIRNTETGQTIVYNFVTGDMIKITHDGDTLDKTINQYGNLRTKAFNYVI